MSLSFLIGCDPNMGHLIQREFPKISVEWSGVISTKTCNISETVQDRTKVTMTD